MVHCMLIDFFLWYEAQRLEVSKARIEGVKMTLMLPAHLDVGYQVLRDRFGEWDENYDIM